MSVAAWTFLVDNAAASVEIGLLETTNSDWNLTERTNVRSIFWSGKFAIEHMARHGGRSIANGAPILSATADPMLPIWTTRKHALLGLTRSIAVTREYASAGVRANAFLPGDMAISMVGAYFASHDDPDEARRAISSAYPVERIADPMELARVIRFLVSNDTSFVNGSSIVVDGGASSLYTG